MKNWEKFKKDIKRIGVEDVCFDKDTKEVRDCRDVYCDICAFTKPSEKNVVAERCSERRTNWLYREVK